MKKKFKSIKKPLLLTFLLLILAVGSYSLYQNINRKEIPDTRTITADGETIRFAPATEAEKKQAEDNKKEQFDSSNSSTPVAPSSSGESSVKIRNAYQDPSTKNAVIQTELSGSGWRKCTLTLTKGTQKVTETADTIYQQSYSSCLGFSVKLPGAGLWFMNLSVSRNDGSTVSAAEKSVSIN